MAGIRISTGGQQSISCVNKIQSIPCKIKYSGEAKVFDYFDSSTKKTEEDYYQQEETCLKKASLRGRPLKGKDVNLPTGYQGYILKEEKQPYSEDEERTLVVKGSFDSFCFWNLENNPTENDNMFKAMDWLEIANVIHCDTDEENKEGTQEQTQTDR